MNTQSGFFLEDESGSTLMDRIAEALPEQVRADYYREMLHFRQLPEEDEMLRILRAMQFLVLLIQQAPGQVAEERKQLSTLLAVSLKSLQQTHQASVDYQKQLEQRIVELPEAIARGISPEAIANKINESLRQQFAKAGLPETAKALNSVSRDLREAAKQFDETAIKLTGTYRGIAAQAAESIANLETRLASATQTAENAARSLTKTFWSEYRWSVAALTSAALYVGFAGGMIVQHGSKAKASAPNTSQSAPMLQAAPSVPAVPATPSIAASKVNRKKHSQAQPVQQEPTMP